MRDHIPMKEMQMMYFPEVVQVVPREDYTVTVYFSDGKIVRYDVKPDLDRGVFRALRDLDTFMNCCTIMNDTLAWDIERNGDPARCIDIDPDMLHDLEDVEDPLAG